MNKSVEIKQLMESSDHQILSEIIEIEDLYDKIDRAEFDFRKSQSVGEITKFWNLYALLWDRNFQELFDEAEKLFKITHEPILKAFIIQAAVAACEILYDLPLRNKWLRLWLLVDDLTSSSYAQYLYYYHKGNSCYFDANKMDSIKLWNLSLEICQEIGYKRGIYRLQFFIGRAYEDLGFQGQARFYYEVALQLSAKTNSIRFSERIKVHLNKNEKSNFLFNGMQIEVFNILKMGKVKKAKKLSLYYCRCRRIEGRKWGADSELILLAMCTALEMKFDRFFRLLSFMDREFTKWITLKAIEILMPKIREFDPRFGNNLDLLNTTQFCKSNKSFELKSNISVDNESERLIQLLKNNINGVSKNAICIHLWNYEYDPVIHDSRIYVSIAKVRKYFGSKSSVINSYGGLYKLNPLLT